MSEATQTWIALLRGINVGGHRKLPMSTLTAILTEAGHRQVTTYIQSGNVVLTGPAAPAGSVAADLRQEIRTSSGLDVPVVVRTVAQWSTMIDHNPFGVDDPTHLHVAFLGHRAPSGAAEKFARAAVGGERFAEHADHVYLHLPDGLGRSKLAGALGAWGPEVTVRNWRTVTALSLLAKAAGPGPGHDG